ncbi:MAG: ribonuclease H-like domain-containing protein [Planctomycetaceae bacterium]|nr:ribonuclease H-like domain-containing protein [Planctomycetaceae bacterium]
MRAYLDIETTGFSSEYCDISVIGIAVENAGAVTLRQLIGPGITDLALMEALSGISRLYTYNGTCFDLPFIRKKLKLDLKKSIPHTDLMHACHKQNLKGGLKAVEHKLGISRLSAGVDGFMAVRLWWDYVNNANADSLNLLLTYNAEDVTNLKTLREKLGIE